MTAHRLRDAGDSAIVLELEERIDPEVNARALSIARRIEAAHIEGVRDVVPTYRTVAVFFDPLVAQVDALRDALAAADDGRADDVPAREVEVPVRYGGNEGPDLDALATLAGLSSEEVVDRHSRVEYRVYMLGFMPGFAYMGAVDEHIAAARHATPRLRVPAGSVGIAGRQTGVYPMDLPGGWQIIGRTSLPVFDGTRPNPALFSPGDRVRFVPESGRNRTAPAAVPPPARRVAPAASTTRSVVVNKPGLFTTVQDAGRWGFQSIGVPVSGAMDVLALHRANALAGNENSAAVLEATIAGPELLIEGPTRIAVDGADLGASFDGRPVAPGQGVTCASRGILRFGARRGGARAYVAFSGGIDTPLVLGSRSTHTRSRLGGLEGRAVRAGDRLPLGAETPRTQAPRPGRDEPIEWPGGARLRVLPGPHDDWFGPDAIDRLLSTRFTVTPSSDRMGYRLTGERAIERRTTREMISDVTVTGALQVPPSGEPILLMADRQTTGGYPQIAVVISADLPRAAQLVPGDWVEFESCSRAEAVGALAAQQASRRA